MRGFRSWSMPSGSQVRSAYGFTHAPAGDSLHGGQCPAGAGSGLCGEKKPADLILALKAAGITRTTEDPQGGLIERDAAGEPNGITYTLEGRYLATLDKDRPVHINAQRTPVTKCGPFMAFGSDNLPTDPRIGLYSAVTHKGQSGTVLGR